MTADFEQLIYNDELLLSSWKNQLRNFEIFASNGNVERGFTDFINWIISTDNAKKLFAGSSLYSLLISKPRNGKLNYQQTLSMQFVNITGLFLLKYSDWDTIYRKEDHKEAIKWKVVCSGIELPNRFIEFLKWNKSWS